MTDSSARKGYLHYFLRHKWRIALTYALTVIGAVLLFLYPYATGLAIDGALKRDGWAILPLAAMWATHLVVDGFRQIYDTRTFTRVFSEAATEMVVAQKGDGKTTSEVAARVNMMEDFTWFMGSHLPDMIIGLISPIGGLIVLFALSPMIALATLILVIAAIAFNAFLFPRLKERQVAINSLNEMSVTRIETAELGVVRSHYQDIGKAFTRISDLNAISWMSVQGMGILVLAYAIWQAGAIEKITPGEAYTLIAYVWRVMDGAFTVPGYAHEFARLIDIWRRINTAA
jgi:ABC-type multidrug transport system fused ATPase/permease subunit